MVTSRPEGTMVNALALTQAVWDVLETIEDPELPVAITDLGLVRDVRVTDGRVAVRLVPTWIGCPALDVIRGRVREALSALPGVREATVEYVFDLPWTLDRMTPRGRARLEGHGLAVPRCRFNEPPACPYCGSRNVSLDSLFGPTMCRAMYVCRACRNPFERLKPPADPEDVPG
jgi:ring-1,2-phenylacetyl-CoA epoxidase subunit PaaD